MRDDEATTFDAFQEQAWATAGEHARGDLHPEYFALGLCEEAGEVAGAARKAGVRLSDVAAANVAKRGRRYPNGFTRADAAARADERLEQIAPDRSRQLLAQCVSLLESVRASDPKTWGRWASTEYGVQDPGGINALIDEARAELQTGSRR